METEPDKLRAVSEKIHNSGAEVSGEAQVEEFPDEYVQYDGIERRTINNEEYLDIMSLCVPGDPEPCGELWQWHPR